MFKAFPYTQDGDQISVEFSYQEEKEAFEAVVTAIKDYLESATPEKEKGKDIFRDLKLKTTLQAEIANDYRYAEAIRKIVGIHVLSVFNKNNITIVRYV